MTMKRYTIQSDRKAFVASATTLESQIREMDDRELFTLWEQAQYGLRGELPYQEWLRRTGYSDMRSARNAHERYQGIAQFLNRKYGASCAILSDLTMRERRHARRFGNERRSKEEPR